jgi:adenosylhomocysteine nucleosidase
MSTASGPGNAAAAAGVAPAPVPVDVGIVAALALEVGFLEDRLKQVRRYAGPRHAVVEGECGGKLVAMVVAGMGRNAASAAARLLLDGHRPRWIVSLGFAGALNLELRRNDIVTPNEVIDLESHRYAIDVVVPSDDQGPRVRTGRLLTVDQIVRTAAEKAELHQRLGADLVDMESSAVAALCSERLVRFLSIRVISDDAHSDLPAEIATLLTRTGSYRVGAAMRMLWKRPSSVKDLWTLHEHAQEAADRLARFAIEAIAHLP